MPKSARTKKPPISPRIWTHGVTRDSLPRIGLAFDRPGPRLPVWLMGDGSGNNVGGPLFGDGSGNNSGGPLFGDGSGNNSGGPLFGDIHLGMLFGEKHKNNVGGGLFGLGYIPDRPDGRDHELKNLADTCAKHSRLAAYCRKGGRAPAPPLPASCDLRKMGSFGKVRMQGAVQSCTAHAVTAMVEYHLRQKTNGSPELSRLFLYKVARESLGIVDDRGCTLRETLKAVNKWGALSEELWPYAWPWLERLPRIAELDEASSSAAKGMGYCRLDDYNSNGDQTIENVLHTVADGFPVVFGYSLFSCIERMKMDANIPVPAPSSKVIGAHSVLAVGYRLRRGNKRREGDLLIRNSWGRDWGNGGYGWLPFEYVKRQLACDFWTMYPKS